MMREPVVAGRFYPPSAATIKKQISSFLPKKTSTKSKVIAAVMPHAGYIYSGKVAVAVVSIVEIPQYVILLGPNHTGLGPALSIMSKGKWSTPMGEVAVNEQIAKTLLSNSSLLKEDISAHTHEHCLEVQLPILQYFSTNFEIVPIVVGISQLDGILSLGQAIAKTLKDSKIQDKTLLVASTDMTHYEPQEQAEAKDKLAIEQILNLNPSNLLEEVAENDISMCGVYPTACVLEAARNLGAKQATLVKYETSGAASGDYSSVVGYAGLIIK